MNIFFCSVLLAVFASVNIKQYITEWLVKLPHIL